MNPFGDIADKYTLSQAVGCAHRLGKHYASPSILDYITARENEFINDLHRAQEEGFPIYIMGSARGGGRQAAICLENAQIPYEGLLVNRAFWTENSPEQCLEDLMERTQTKVCIVIAFRGYHEGILNPYRNRIGRLIVRDCFAGIRTAGDSAAAFVDALRQKGIEAYEEIVSFEPDSGNCGKMRHRNLPRHTCVCKGVAESPGIVSFTADGTSGRVEADGGEQIELESIDHYLNGTCATMIKMDIEGMELSALRGAEQTIRTWRPKLAICIYHKREDLWEIPEYIKKLVPDYRLYIRAYADTTCELVLYAL